MNNAATLDVFQGWKVIPKPPEGEGRMDVVALVRKAQEKPLRGHKKNKSYAREITLE